MDSNQKILHCTICLEDILDDLEFLPCIHEFHKSCIDELIKETPICPLCPVCKIPIYVNTKSQLDDYKIYKEYNDKKNEEESAFFQRVSAGFYDNDDSELNVNNVMSDSDNAQIISFLTMNIMGNLTNIQNNNQNNEQPPDDLDEINNDSSD